MTTSTPTTSDEALRHAWRVRVAALCALMLASCASTPTPTAGDAARAATLQHDDAALRRVELLALLQTLNADLLSHDSATLTLERWCADHRLSDTPRVLAHRVHGVDKALPPALRARLAIGPDERVAYRRVELACGAQVLSEADNWYVPARLTPEMNRVLDETDEPFGKVVRALDFRRRTLSADLLWSPLPPGWEMSPETLAAALRTPLAIPHALLRHEAVLSAHEQPFSVVVETYTEAVLRFGPGATNAR